VLVQAGVLVRGHAVVADVPTHDLTQPCTHCWDRIVQPSPKLGLHLAQLRLHPLPDRLPHHREPPTPLLPADVREAEEFERLRLPLVGALPVLGREGPEFHQPRLLGVQLHFRLGLFAYIPKPVDYVCLEHLVAMACRPT